MEQFGKAVVAIILAAVLAFIAIKAEEFVARTAQTKTKSSPSIQEGHRKGTAQD